MTLPRFLLPAALITPFLLIFALAAADRLLPARGRLFIPECALITEHGPSGLLDRLLRRKAPIALHMNVWFEPAEDGRPTAERLSDIGFPAGSEALPRRGYVVLESDGPAVEAARKATGLGLPTIRDADIRAGALLSRYGEAPNRAIARARFVFRQDARTGHVLLEAEPDPSRLYPDGIAWRVFVPEQKSPNVSCRSRYRLEVIFGSLGIPHIAQIHAMESGLESVGES
ncbi:MAG: hypothetical protein Tsb008_17570 [Rhodothalassiaceae bacterium]